MVMDNTPPAPSFEATRVKKQNPVFVIHINGGNNNNNNTNDDIKNNKNPPVPNKQQRKNNQKMTQNSNTKVVGRTLHVIVIAHPDDESMFFLPTIQRLRQAGETIWILCMTTGNYDGLGDQRKLELSRLSQLLNIDKLIHLDVEELQDHPTKSWSLDRATFHMERALGIALRNYNTENSPQAPANTFSRVILITFDLQGVSGHVNHRDTYLGVRNLVVQQEQQKLQQQEQQQQQQQQHQGSARKRNKQQQQQQQSTTVSLPPLEAWTLDTVHILPLKYFPIVEWCFVLLSMCGIWKPTYTPFPKQTMLQNVPENKQQDPNSGEMIHVFRSVDFMLSWKAMATHDSQFVWYRRLFVIFSCYTFVNKLRPVQ